MTDPKLIGRAGLAACGLSVALTFAVAAAGPSLMEPALPGRPGQPPWSLAAHPAPALVTGLSATAILAGAAGLAVAIAALRRGWALRPAWLLAAGLGAALALAAVPPTGSADPLSYAAYGRIAATGHDPYVTTPAVPGPAGAIPPPGPCPADPPPLRSTARWPRPARPWPRGSAARRPG